MDSRTADSPMNRSALSLSPIPNRPAHRSKLHENMAPGRRATRTSAAAPKPAVKAVTPWSFPEGSC